MVHVGEFQKLEIEKDTFSTSFKYLIPESVQRLKDTKSGVERSRISVSTMVLSTCKTWSEIINLMHGIGMTGGL